MLVRRATRSVAKTGSDARLDTARAGAGGGTLQPGSAGACRGTGGRRHWHRRATDAPPRPGRWTDADAERPCRPAHVLSATAGGAGIGIWWRRRRRGADPALARPDTTGRPRGRCLTLAFLADRLAVLLLAVAFLALLAFAALRLAGAGLGRGIVRPGQTEQTERATKDDGQRAAARARVVEGEGQGVEASSIHAGASLGDRTTSHVVRPEHGGL